MSEFLNGNICASCTKHRILEASTVVPSVFVKEKYILNSFTACHISEF